MRRFFPVLFMVAALAGVRGAIAESATALDRKPEARKIWEVSVETAQTLGADNSSDNYFSTQFVSLAVEPFRPLVLGPVRLRGQLINSFVASAILEGPDQYFLGWAPQIRVIAPLADTRWSLYGTFGAGMGTAQANQNATDDGGLGQDFNFLLMANAGLRYAITESWSVWAGGMWLHLSSAGQSEPQKQNIGADSFGAVIGTGWAF
ncbi:MAG: hypothetical protein FGM15_01680 [Chthoniobacterales bacterium]|nr:hypothetical protein [Chthoniobacterales bacterium]